MTNTILTPEQIETLFRESDDLYAFCHAIEQAVLQSPEVQAWREDAGRYRWLRDDNAYFPEEHYIRGGQELDEEIDYQMEKQP